MSAIENELGVNVRNTLRTRSAFRYRTGFMIRSENWLADRLVDMSHAQGQAGSPLALMVLDTHLGKHRLGVRQ